MLGNKDKKRAAVVIGTNYPGSSCQLSGCVNDANNMVEFLTSHCGYELQNIHLLTDDGQPANMKNMLEAFDWLVNKAVVEKCTELWLSYSGHGSYVDDTNGDEDDGRDEALCPCDCDTTGFIIDDDIFEHLVSKLPAGVNLFAVLDCCHSGSMLDLPLIYSTGDKSSRKVNNTHIVNANVVSISGCRDEQTSADAYISGKYAGALTWSFLTAMKEHKYSVTLVDLVDTIRKLLKGKYEQVPMLALSHDELYNQQFIGSKQEANSRQEVVVTTHAITFDLTADMHPRESAWNVWVEDTKKWLFPVDATFTQRYQHTVMTVNLRFGKYKLVVRDSFGDGGVTVMVTDGNYNLVDETKAKGKLAEFPFKIKK